MKICQKCGKIYEADTSKFCKSCGTPLSDYQGNARQQPMQKQAHQRQGRQGEAPQDHLRQQGRQGEAPQDRLRQQMDQEVPSRKKLPRGAVIGMIVGIVIVLVLAVAVVLKLTGVFDSGSDSRYEDRLDDDRKDEDQEDGDDSDDDENGETEDGRDESDGESDDETDENASDSETDAPETLDISKADINAVDDEVQTLTGQFSWAAGTGEGIVALEKAVTIYANDMNFEPVLVENVTEIRVANIDAAHADDAGHQVELKGTLMVEDGTVILLTEDFVVLDPDKPHTYKVVLLDCSWQYAQQAAAADGGYLATIESVEEYNTIASSLNSSGNPKSTHYYLGGRREYHGEDYFWVDAENVIKSDFINPDEPGTWTTNYWFDGEPSYYDIGSDGSYEDIEECYVGLLQVNGVWYLNDMSGDMLEDYGTLLQGKVGYVIEYDN